MYKANKGCCCPGNLRVNVCMYDLTTLLQGIQSFERLSITLDRFGIFSDLRLNTEKTEALWLGRNHNNPPHVNAGKINLI